VLQERHFNVFLVGWLFLTHNGLCCKYFDELYEKVIENVQYCQHQLQKERGGLLNENRKVMK
jgi:hypothetical protein